MALAVVHNKVATLPDDPSVEVGADEWNESHILVQDGESLLGRSLVGSGPTTTLTPAAVRTLLGLGTFALFSGLTGPITANGAGVTAVAAQTGTGSVFAMQAAPTFTGLVTINAGGSLMIESPVVAYAAVKTTAINSHAFLYLDRFAEANSFARLMLQTASATRWSIGLRAGDDHLHFFHEATPVDRLILSAAGNLAWDGSPTALRGRIQVPADTTDSTATVYFSGLNVVANTVVGYPAFGYNIMSGGAANTWRYQGGDNVSWIQFRGNIIEFLQNSNAVVAGNVITNRATLTLNANGTTTIHGSTGIGGAPDASWRLRVVQAVNWVALLEATTGVAYVQLRSNNGGGNYGSQILFQDGATASANITSVASGQLRFGILNVEKLFLTSTGFGVGNAPVQTFDVWRDGVRGTYAGRFHNSGYAITGITIPSSIRAGAVAYGAYIGGQPDYVAGDLSTGFYGFVPGGGHGAGAVAAIFNRDDTNVRTVFQGGASITDTIYVEKTYNTSTGLPMYLKDSYTSLQQICSIATASGADLYLTAHDHPTSFSRLWVSYAGKTTAGTLYINASMNAANAAMLAAVNLAGLSIGTNNDIPIGIATASVERMRIQSGTTGTRVQITGSAAGGLGAELRLINTAGAGSDYSQIAFMSGGSYRSVIRSTVEGPPYMGGIGFYTGETTIYRRMYLHGQMGYLGIGLDLIPRQMLDVSGNIVTDWSVTRYIGMQYSDGSAYFLGMKLDPSSRRLDIYAFTGDDTGHITFSTGVSPGERARIDPSGQVMFGVSNKGAVNANYQNVWIGGNALLFSSKAASAGNGLAILANIYYDASNVGRYTSTGLGLSCNIVPNAFYVMQVASGSAGAGLGANTPLFAASSNGFGYGGDITAGSITGAGGAVTQITNKATGVTLHKVCGTITTHNANLAAQTAVIFTVTNNKVALNDRIILHRETGGTSYAYDISVSGMANGSFEICIFNRTGGGLAEAIVIGFAIIKGTVT